jgi:hypothetical protein
LLGWRGLGILTDLAWLMDCGERDWDGDYDG